MLIHWYDIQDYVADQNRYTYISSQAHYAIEHSS